MAIAGVLFDKDGTLLDFHKTWGPLNVAAANLAARGDRQLAERLLALGGYDSASGRTAADSLLASSHNLEIAEAWVRGGSPFDAEDLADELNRYFTSATANAIPVTDLAAFFSRLKARGLKLGIASSDSEAGIRAMATHFGLIDLIDYIAGYDSGHGVKPGGGMVDGFARATGLHPETIAVVGDNLHDMHMAANGGAGLRVGVLTGTGTRATLEPESDHCLEAITGLEDILFPVS